MCVQAEIQGAMDARLNTLEATAVNLDEGLETIRQFSPRTTLQGVELEADIVDTKRLAEQLAEKQRALRDKGAAPGTTGGIGELAKGEQTAPIIIVERPDDDPFEKYLIVGHLCIWTWISLP